MINNNHYLVLLVLVCGSCSAATDLTVTGSDGNLQLAQTPASCSAKDIPGYADTDLRCYQLCQDSCGLLPKSLCPEKCEPWPAWVTEAYDTGEPPNDEWTLFDAQDGVCAVCAGYKMRSYTGFWELREDGVHPRYFKIWQESNPQSQLLTELRGSECRTVANPNTTILTLACDGEYLYGRLYGDGNMSFYLPLPPSVEGTIQYGYLPDYGRDMLFVAGQYAKLNPSMSYRSAVPPYVFHYHYDYPYWSFVKLSSAHVTESLGSSQ